MQIKKSETQVALYAALARAQSQISVPGKNAVNPAFKSQARIVRVPWEDPHSMSLLIPEVGVAPG